MSEVRVMTENTALKLKRRLDEHEELSAAPVDFNYWELLHEGNSLITVLGCSNDASYWRLLHEGE